MKAWQEELPARGKYTQHPFVLNLCASAELTPRAQRFHDGTLTVFAYCRTRLHLDRQSWEALPADDGVLLVRIRSGSETRHFCASRDELDAVFGEVRSTKSWTDVRHYSFPELPPAARSLIVESSTAFEDSGPIKLAIRKRNPEMTSEISDPFAFVQHWWGRRGPLVQDSEEYIRSIDLWRDFWRPERVRVLLIAESHVAEATGDSEARVALDASILQATNLPGLPDRYTRLVYCLGYGIDSVCDPAPQFSNPDTPFWGIFEALVSGHPLLTNESDTQRNLAHHRILILQALRERGIWLVDASVIALYHPSGIKLFNPSMRKKIIRQSYEQFVWPSVQKDMPQEIWVIGKEVGKALHGRPEIVPDHVISQPGDRNQGEYQRGLSRMTQSVLRLYEDR